MKSKESLAKAINDSIQNIIKSKKRESVDYELFVTQCIKEFSYLDLPFYSIALDKNDEKKIVLQVPFAKECHIQLEQYKFGSSQKAVVLYMNGSPVRKIKLEKMDPNYMANVAHGLLDYLNRYIILRNQFNYN